MKKINIFSFGHKFYLPDQPQDNLTIQKIWDVRAVVKDPFPKFLESGLDKKVSEYILGQPNTIKLIKKIKLEIEKQIKRLGGSRYKHIDIFIGCYGGYQRSVAITEHLFAWLNENNKQLSISIGHLSIAQCKDYLDKRDMSIQ